MKKGYVKLTHYLLFICLFTTTIPVPTKAQKYITKYFNNEKGNLPSVLSKTILNDKSGYIWIGTDGGLIRYDGYTYKVIRDRLHSQYVKSIIQLNNGNLLVATDMGISKIVNYPDSVQVISVLDGGVVPTDSTVYYPRSLFQAKSGDIWVGETNAILRYGNGHFKRYYVDKKYQPANYSRSFMFSSDKSGRIWVASQDGNLFYYSEKEDSLMHVSLPDNLDNDSGFLISAMKEQPDGWIWLGTSYGVYRFLPTQIAGVSKWSKVVDMPPVSCLTRVNDGKGFVGTWLNGLYEISENEGHFVAKHIPTIKYDNINNLSLGGDRSLWISSIQGFILMYPRMFLTAPINSKSKYINSLVIGSNSTIYSTNGYSIFKNGRASNDYSMHTICQAVNNQQFSSLALMNGNLFAGTFGGNVYEVKKKQLHNIVRIKSKGMQVINYMYPSDNEHLWICDNALTGVALYRPGKGITYYGSNKGANVNFNVVRSSKNNLIIAGATGNSSYLYVYDERNDRFLNISASLPNSIFGNKRKHLVVNDMTFRRGNHLLLATNYGLISLTLNGLRKAKFDRQLIKGHLKSVVVDGNDNVWVGSEKGLFDIYRGEVTRFDENDGLTSLSISFAGMVIDGNNHLWVATSNGLIYSKKPLTNFSKATVPMIRNILIDNKAVNYHPGRLLKLNKGENITIRLTALTYPTDKVRYETILADKNDRILYQGKADANQLNIPIDYQGMMKIYIVTNKSGYNWSDPVILQLDVSLPWYLRWWAYILYAVILCIVIFIIIDYRHSKKLQKREREKFERQDRIMWQTLDVVPHFVYARDSEGRYLLANKALLDAYDTTREALIGNKDEDVISNKADIENILKTDKQVIESGKSMKFSEDFQMMSGEIKKLLVTKVPFKLDGEKSDAVAGVGVDITDLNKVQEALRESENRFKMLAEAAYEGIIISEEGKIIDVNRRILEISGFERDDLVGKTVWDFVPDDKQSILQEFASERGEGPFETELYRKGNVRYPAIIQGREFTNQGRLLRMTAIRDITEEKKAEEALKEYALKLENSNKELQDFAYVASHDLQEPLRKIQAFGDLLVTDLGKKISEDAKFYLERMRSASSRMQKLINGLLSFSRVTTKAKPYELVDLNKVAKEVLGDLEIRIKESGAEIKMDALPQIDADPLQMRQLFQNILGNALKFIKKDVKPVLRIETTSVTDGVSDSLKGKTETCTLVLSDNGIGFDQKYADKIFSVFERLHNRTEYEGTGIGLAICRKIVERHNGKISVQSKEGEGTSFIITLPLHQITEKKGE